MKEELIVTRIRNYVLGLTEISGHPNIDYHHAIHVSENIKILAYNRGLNQADAQLIAWLHDIGRMKAFEGEHAISGALEAERLLNQYELVDEKVKLIKEAILNHSDKDRIDDKYSELIKDADSMAHKRENEDLDAYESFRADWAMVSVDIKSEFDPEKIISLLMLELDRGFNEPLNNCIVERMYKSLAHVKTLLWLLRGHDCWHEDFDDMQVKVDKLFELVKKAHGYHRMGEVAAFIKTNERLKELLGQIAIIDLKPLIEPINQLELDTDSIVKEFVDCLEPEKLKTQEGIAMVARFYGLHEMNVLMSPCIEFLGQLIKLLVSDHIHEQMDVKDEKKDQRSDAIKLEVFKAKKIISQVKNLKL